MCRNSFLFITILLFNGAQSSLIGSLLNTPSKLHQTIHEIASTVIKDLPDININVESSFGSNQKYPNQYGGGNNQQPESYEIIIIEEGGNSGDTNTHFYDKQRPPGSLFNNYNNNNNGQFDSYGPGHSGFKPNYDNSGYKPGNYGNTGFKPNHNQPGFDFNYNGQIDHHGHNQPNYDSSPNYGQRPPYGNLPPFRPPYHERPQENGRPGYGGHHHHHYHGQPHDHGFPDNHPATTEQTHFDHPENPPKGHGYKPADSPTIPKPVPEHPSKEHNCDPASDSNNHNKPDDIPKLPEEPKTTTAKPKRERPVLIPLKPGEYEYSGDKIIIHAPKDPSKNPSQTEEVKEDDQQIDIRFRDE